MSESEKPMFADAKVGDRVWHTRHGWALINGPLSGGFHACAEKSPRTGFWFGTDGRQDSTDASPSVFWDEVHITPPPRPKRKVTKTTEIWVNVYERDKVVQTSYWSSKGMADYHAGRERLDCVKVTVPYEVEE